MALTIGTQFGSHEITALLGKGGMGEVYRARDLKLKREVAIKVLPEEFSRDADRLSRFQREAEVLASLNHPNIATIYDLQEVSGSRYLVLELVEGETLADRLKHGALPVEEALNIAKSICEALEAAHEKGIVHRDLKPANVKITPDGKVKVLDFGLAKAMDNAPANAALSNSPTMMTGTLGGVILGTAAYMSPEQARGKPVDRRADIWAFGVVLYELLTGKLPFEGEDVTEILAAVVKERPDLSVIPANLRPLIERCLEKDPKKRLRDIGDVWAVVEAQAQTVGPPFLHRLLWPVIAALAGIVAVSVSLIHFREKAPRPPQLMRFQIYPPENGDFGSFPFSSVDFSHDGRRLAYISRGQDGRSRVWIRELGNVESHPLTGTEEAVILWWSPDDRYLAFRSGVELKKIESSGGIPQTLCECLVVAQGAWNEDGTILFSSGHGIVKIPSSGGDASPVTTLNLSRGESIHFLPSFLPDGRHFLYFRGSATADDSGLFAGSLDLKPDQQPLNRLLDVPGRYVASSNSTEGYVMFSRGDSLFLQPFNKNRLRLDGDPTLVADNTNALNSYSASAEGMLAYTNNTGLARFTWLDRNGKVLGAMGEPAIQGNPNISRKTGTVAFDRDSSGPSDIWLYDPKLAGHRFTFNVSDNEMPVWSPGGDDVVFTSNKDGGWGLYRKSASGVGDEEQLSNSEIWATDWSGDGKYIIVQALDRRTKDDIWLVPTFGDKKPFPYLNGDAQEAAGKVSPDGKWLAYMSNVTGRYEVYVQSFAPGTPPAKRGNWPISINGGTRPVWSHDGKELFFVGADRKMMVVQVSNATANRFEADVPKPLFESPISGDPFDPFDVDKDGRFLVRLPVEHASAPITVIVDWPAMLAKKK